MNNNRKWNVVNSLSYLYSSFAIITDGRFDEAEKEKIFEKVKTWSKVEGDFSEPEILAILDQSLQWFSEDLKKDQSEENSQTIIETCMHIAKYLKNNLQKEQCEVVYNDLIIIGKADGYFDENEQAWTKIFGEELGAI